MTGKIHGGRHNVSHVCLVCTHVLLIVVDIYQAWRRSGWETVMMEWYCNVQSTKGFKPLPGFKRSSTKAALANASNLTVGGLGLSQVISVVCEAFETLEQM